MSHVNQHLGMVLPMKQPYSCYTSVIVLFRYQYQLQNFMETLEGLTNLLEAILDTFCDPRATYNPKTELQLPSSNKRSNFLLRRRFPIPKRGRHLFNCSANLTLGGFMDRRRFIYMNKGLRNRKLSCTQARLVR